MTYLEQQQFYEDLVRRLRSRGALCAITSGLACVHYGIAETTKDCDLLCHTASFQNLFELLVETPISGHECRYRGNISPPLDVRWHQGGWTSHFEWVLDREAVTLDVFGHALRESSPWPLEVLGLYAGPNTVAEMKRTNRDRDWAVVTALGVRMIEADDDRGWLHIFDAATLTELLTNHPCPSDVPRRRPSIQFALDQDRRVAGALSAERKLWEELDRLRIRILERHLRPFVAAMRKARAETPFSFREDHDIRVACANEWLPPNPLRDYGLRRYVEEAKSSLVESAVIPENALAWVPDVALYFEWLNK